MPRWSAFLAVLTLAACSHRQARGPVTAGAPAEVGVIVENQFSGMITVFLEAGGRSIRLGEVHFSETKSFVVPWRSVGDGLSTQLRGEVIGSEERVLTSDLRMRPGSVVRWTLTPRLSMSYYTVY